MKYENVNQIVIGACISTLALVGLALERRIARLEDCIRQQTALSSEWMRITEALDKDLEGKYYRVRSDVDELIEHTEGVQS